MAISIVVAHPIGMICGDNGGWQYSPCHDSQNLGSKGKNKRKKEQKEKQQPNRTKTLHSSLILPALSANYTFRFLFVTSEHVLAFLWSFPSFFSDMTYP